MKPVIFYVDDEPMNLTVFEAGLPEDWDIRTFDNPQSALAEIKSMRPWVVVSDQRMPGMKGVDFLDQVRKQSPQSVRIVATGFSDEQLIIESVRRAKIFDYIRKPWDSDDLQNRLELAIQHYRSENQIRNHGVVTTSSESATPSHSQATSALGIASISIDAVTGEISADALSAQLLFGTSDAGALTRANASRIFDETEFKDFFQQISVTESNTVTRQMIRGNRTLGANKWFLVHGRGRSNIDASSLECVVVEVTTMKLAEDKIVRHSEEITKTNDYLTEFANYLSVAAADPIRNLSNYLELLSNQKLVRDEPALCDLTDRALDCARGLKHSMQIIYRLSKVSFAKLELETVSLDAIFARLMHELESLRNMNICISSAGLPQVWGDNDLVFQLISNLLTAIKPSATSSINIAPSSDASHEWIEFSFTNIEISDEELSSAFSMSNYSEIGANRPIDRAALILAKTIAERMNGSLSLNRCGETGLTIHLKLSKTKLRRSRSSLKLIA
jgi:FixJ family two-component response regulator